MHRLLPLLALVLFGCTRTEMIATPQRQGAVVDGSQEGAWTYRHDDGSVAATGSFQGDKPIGAWEWRTPTGQVQAQGSFSAGGNREGLWTFLNAAGEQIRIVYARGRAVTPPPATPTPSAAATTLPLPVPTTAPVAITVPTTWTVGQERAAADLITAYTRNVGGTGPYGERVDSVGSPQGPALVGRDLVQRRFLAADGRVVDLGRAKRPAVLVLMRGFSGTICVYCATQTAALANATARFEAAGVDLLVVYPGPVEAVPAFIEAVRGLRTDPPPMPVLLDAGLELVQELGLIDTLAQPTSLIVDPGGRIRWAYVGATADDRPSVATLLQAVKNP